MLELDEATHTYKLDGQAVAGVTRCLDVAGLVDFSFVREEILMNRSQLGLAVHLAGAYLTEGSLDEETVDNQLRPYVESLRKLWAKVNFRPRLIEHQCLGKLDGLPFGMRCDFEGEIFGSEAILDMKIGKPHWAHGVQLTGYAIGLPHREINTPMAKFTRRKRYGIYLRDDGEIATLKPYTNKRDFVTFAAALEITSRKMLEGVKVRRLDDWETKGDNDVE